MLPKILSQDSNYDEWCEQELLNAYKDAAEYDDFLFGDHDYSYVWKDTKSNDVVQIEEAALLFFMVHLTDIYELKAKLNGLKHDLDKEPSTWEQRELANKYLNKVLDYLNELRLF